MGGRAGKGTEEEGGRRRRGTRGRRGEEKKGNGLTSTFNMKT